MEANQMLYAIAVLTFLFTVGGFIWKMSALASKVQQNEQKADALRLKVDRMRESRDAEMEEMKRQIISILQSQARIEEKIINVIDELKSLRLNKQAN